MVIMFSIVSGVTSVLFLVWVMGKLENRQKEIDALSSRVDIAKQEKATVTEELRVTKERLVTTRKQRDDSTAKVKTTTKTNKQHLARLPVRTTIFCSARSTVRRAICSRRRQTTAPRRTRFTSRSRRSSSMAMDQRKVNALLWLNLEKSLAQLQGFHFHAELHLRSAEITKKTVGRLQNKVEELQCSMVTLQLSASTPSRAAAATSAKDDATAAIPDDSSTGTVSTTLSPSPSGSGSNSNSSSVSRTSSGISTDTSNSDDHAIAQPVVASAPVIPTLPSPSNGGAAPAGCHAGPHDRPKRDKRNRRGQQHDGKTRSSAKATKRKQEGLWRGYS